MSERKRAKELWDEKMRDHKGSTSEADYLYATGKYDRPLPGSLDVGDEGKPSFFNGRKKKNTASALAAIALIGGYPAGNNLGQEIEGSASGSEMAQTEIASIGSVALFDETEIRTTQTNFEDISVRLLVPNQTIVVHYTDLS